MTTWNCGLVKTPANPNADGATPGVMRNHSVSKIRMIVVHFQIERQRFALRFYTRDLNKPLTGLRIGLHCRCFEQAAERGRGV